MNAYVSKKKSQKSAGTLTPPAQLASDPCFPRSMGRTAGAAADAEQGPTLHSTLLLVSSRCSHSQSPALLFLFLPVSCFALQTRQPPPRQPIQNGNNPPYQTPSPREDHSAISTSSAGGKTRRGVNVTSPPPHGLGAPRLPLPSPPSRLLRRRPSPTRLAAGSASASAGGTSGPRRTAPPEAPPSPSTPFRRHGVLGVARAAARRRKSATPQLTSSALTAVLIFELGDSGTVQRWQRLGVARRWLASDASAAAEAAELVEVPLAQTGEGIAECELLRWFVNEVSARQRAFLAVAPC